MFPEVGKEEAAMPENVDVVMIGMGPGGEVAAGTLAEAGLSVVGIEPHLVGGDWLFRAACRMEEPELFFPVGTSGPALVQTARAKAVCQRCPVMIQCRTWALTTGQAAGVWGGMSEDERREMRRRDRVDLLLPRGLRVPPQPQDESRTAGIPTRLPQPGKPATKRAG